jgi:hypothetical protein
MAEAYAMNKGVSLAIHIRWNRIIVELDCTGVIEACSGGDAWSSEPASIYAECVDNVVMLVVFRLNMQKQIM